MIPAEHILEGGSKLEFTRYLIETGLDKACNIPLPESAWLYSGESISQLRAQIMDMLKHGNVIVRGSAAPDYHGAVDVFKTVRSCASFQDVEDAIRSIEAGASDPHVRQHINDWNRYADMPDEWRIPFDSRVNFLIQEQVSDIVGTIIRHPHTGEFLINYIDITKHHDYAVSSYQTWNNHLVPFDIEPRTPVGESALWEVIRTAKRLEESGVLDPAFSHQIEFSLSPLTILQARPFKPYQKAYKTEFCFDRSAPHYYSTMCFGLTPPEGIDVDIECIRHPDIFAYTRNDDQPYGLMLTRPLTCRLPIWHSLGNLRLYMPNEENTLWMHEGYAQMKYAKITAANPILENLSDEDGFPLDNKEAAPLFRQSRVFSNGERACIVPRQFL